MTIPALHKVRGVKKTQKPALSTPVSTPRQSALRKSSFRSSSSDRSVTRTVTFAEPISDVDVNTLPPSVSSDSSESGDSPIPFQSRFRETLMEYYAVRDSHTPVDSQRCACGTLSYIRTLTRQ